MSKTCVLAAAIALLTCMIGTGCSKGSSDTDRANDVDHRTTTADPLASAIEFAACMRANGVTEFPDPDASGQLTIDGVVNGSTIDTDGPVWSAAIGACEDLQPPGFTGRERSASEQEQALAFAQCIRDHGVEDFPDPAEGEPLVNTYNIPSSDTEAGMASLNAAMDACGDLIADLLSDQP